MSVLTTASTFSPDADRLFRDDLMRAHSLDRVVATFHFGDDGVVIVAVEPSAVADLAAGFGVERRVVEDDFAFFAGLEFLHALTVVDDGENFAAIGTGLAVALEVGFRKLLVGGIGGLLGRAFPGGASAFALLLHGTVKTLIESDALITCRILHEIERHAESVVELESLFAGRRSSPDCRGPCVGTCELLLPVS